MFNFIKGLLTKKEMAKIKELELENEKLKKELNQLEESSMDMFLELQCLNYEKDVEEDQEDNEKCSCGGDMLPMYEEHPNWIKFCVRCDSRTDDSIYSPIKEPSV